MTLSRKEGGSVLTAGHKSQGFMRSSIPVLDLVTMKLFASVVEQGNIAAASRINNIAASAVSKRISDLEALLGVKLLYRLKDGVEPTPGGLVLVRHIQRILAQLGDLDAEISEYAEGDKGQVRVWANTSAVTQFLPEDLTHYLGQYPDVGILLKEETSGIIINAVRDGLADIGIFSEHTGHSGLETRVYRRDTLMVIVPRGHELEGRRGVRMLDVAQYQQVGLQDGSSLQAKLADEAIINEKALRFRVKVMSFDGVRRMVEAGLGVAVLPAGAVLPYLGTGMFSSVALDEPWATRALFIGYRDYKALPVVARALLDLLAPE